MSQPNYDDTYDDQDDDGQQDQNVTLSRSQIRAMERDAKNARKATDEAAQLKRELAFARAGHDFTDKQQKALLSTVEGDLTAESIRAAAEELGFLTPAAPKPDDSATDRITAAASGSPSETTDDPLARLHRADREGGKEGVLAELRRAGLVEVVNG